MSGVDPAREEAERAAAEAGAIGGRVSSEPQPEAIDEAQRPVDEAGQGESEGFEEAERQLVDHASHGDQHAARRVIEDAPLQSDDARASEGGESDFARSSEREDERR